MVSLRSSKWPIFLVCMLLLSLSSFWVGGYIASMRIGSSVHEVQAILAFKHFVAYDELHSSLAAGCVPQVIAKLAFMEEEQKKLMAEYIQGSGSGGETFEDYVSLRRPELLDELRQYNVNWSRKLSVPGCEDKANKE